MSGAIGEEGRFNCSECCGFLRLLRSFRMCLHWSKLIPAFCGVFATYAAGHLLDWVWPESSEPVVQVAAGRTVTELSYFLSAEGIAGETTREWIDGLASAESLQHIGAFDLILQHARVTANQITDSVIHANFGGVVDGFSGAFRGVVWLMSMHSVYAVIFFLVLVAIWAFFGGAISRAAALDIAREHKLGLREVFGFAKSHFGNLAAVPLVPIIFVLVGGLILWIGGLIGAIPAVGEVLVGLLFLFVLVVGFFIALVMICGVAGFPMMMPAIAADNLDALDALSTTYSYVGSRPWKTAFYILLATGYGAVCLVFVKLFVMVMLWAVGLFMGASMNWGDAFALDATGAGTKIESKLEAMWQAPTFADDRTFYGTFPDNDLRHVSRFGQWCLRAWIYTLWAFVAACAVSFFYTAGSVMYFLLRREVDLTDWEDVYLDSDDEAFVPAPAATTGNTADSSTKSDA